MTSGTDPYNVDSDDDGYWDPHDANPLDAKIPLEEEGGKAARETETGPASEQAPEIVPATAPAEPSTSPATSTVSPTLSAANELQEVQVAVRVMMRTNKLSQLPNPVKVPTCDMHRFPDDTTRHGQAGGGYVLFLHDFDGNGKPDTNYVHSHTTNGTYICDKYGNITQVSTGYE